MNVTAIPLDKLQSSPRNARKATPSKINALARSIDAHGLLHNLTVLAADPAGMYAVIDGGRRLLALQSLAQKNKVPADHPVACLVRGDSEYSTEISAAANSFIEPMHPADQCDAFRAMIDQEGATIAGVAHRFSVSELIVKQRLKLAKVSPKLVALFRADEMQLDQMQALAITDDHDAQERAWFDVKNKWERNAGELRERLTKKMVGPNDSRAQFVGVDAYEAAGGVVVRDLFDSKAGGYLTDVKLLDRLVNEKLDTTARELREAGWSWVEVRSKVDHETNAEYKEIARPTARKATDEEAAQLQDLHAREEPLLVRYQELEEIDNATDEQDAELQHVDDELTDISDKREAIDAARLEYSPAVKTASGVLIELGSNGVRIHPARLKPGETLKKGTLDVVGAKRDNGKADKPKVPELSDALAQRLRAQRTAAMQSLLVDDPSLAFTALLHCLVSQLFYDDHFATALHLRPTDKHDQLATVLKNEHSAAIDGVANHHHALRERLPSNSDDLLKWLEDARTGHETRDLLMAHCVALTLDPYLNGTRDDGAGNAIAKLLHLDMADHWQPTAETYLAHVPKPLILEAVTEACGKEAAAMLVSLKKDALIAEASKQLAGTGWLPKPLRGSGYALKKPNAAAAPPKPKAAATKAAAKKAAKKKPAKKAAPKIPAQSRSAS